MATEVDTISPEFAKALVMVQGNIEGARKGKVNPFHHNNYADLSNCWDACREALQGANISLLQFPTEAPAGSVGLKTLLIFGPTGEVLGDTFHLAMKDPTNPQAAGSAITYMRRYALCASVGICPEDDDGNKASAPAKPKYAKTEPDHSGGEKGFMSAADFESRFKAAGLEKDVTGMKGVYSELKNSAVSEPLRTALLSNFAKTIKESNK